MLRCIRSVSALQNFQGEFSAKYFVRTFGGSFIIAAALNFVRSFLWADSLTIMETRPEVFATVCLVCDIITEIIPLSLMLVMHRKNFGDEGS